MKIPQTWTEWEALATAVAELVDRSQGLTPEIRARLGISDVDRLTWWGRFHAGFCGWPPVAASDGDAYRAGALALQMVPL